MSSERVVDYLLEKAGVPSFRVVALESMVMILFGFVMQVVKRIFNKGLIELKIL